MGRWRRGIGRARTGEGPTSRLRRGTGGGSLSLFQTVVVKDWGEGERNCTTMLVQTGGREGGGKGEGEKEKKREKVSGSSSAAESLVSLHGCKEYRYPRSAPGEMRARGDGRNSRLSARVGGPKPIEGGGVSGAGVAPVVRQCALTVEELLDEVYVGEDHPPAAVALEGESVEGLSAGAGGMDVVSGQGDRHQGELGVRLPFVVACFEELEVGGPAVTDDLATCERGGAGSAHSKREAGRVGERTREASDWDNHGCPV